MEGEENPITTFEFNTHIKLREALAEAGATSIAINLDADRPRATLKAILAGKEERSIVYGTTKRGPGRSGPRVSLALTRTDEYSDEERAVLCKALILAQSVSRKNTEPVDVREVTVPDVVAAVSSHEGNVWVHILG